MIIPLIRRTARIVGLILLSAGACLASDGAKGSELNRALEEIALAVRLIDAGAAAAEIVHGKLQAQAEALSAEIRRERVRGSAATFQQALQVDRIRYDLLVLQQVRGYLVQLGDRLAYLRTAAHTLNAFATRSGMINSCSRRSMTSTAPVSFARSDRSSTNTAGSAPSRF